MKLIIDFIDETESLDQNQIQTIEDLFQYAAEIEGIPADTEVSVTFVDNDKIQEINRYYRGKDQPTDVISFAMEEMGEGEIEILGEVPKHLGDIIISLQKTREQAEEYNHSFQRELGFLSIHGLLHLLGYDHMNENDEQKMFSKQEEILSEFGLRR